MSNKAGTCCTVIIVASGSVAQSESDMIHAKTMTIIKIYITGVTV